MFLILILVNIPIPDDLSDTFSNQSSHENLPLGEPEILEVRKVTSLPPPAPKLPLMELLIIFIINNKVLGERSREMNPNEDFESFNRQLTNLVTLKLPKGLTIYSDGVNVSFQRAYVTKGQERKRKDLPWKEFADGEDYLGLCNAIRSSPKPYAMTVMIQAFITVPKENFVADTEPAFTSQRLVCL